MKKKLLIVFIFVHTICVPQIKVELPRIVAPLRIDKVIKTPIYTSYFSYSAHNPLFVTYVLFHGGGDCSRQAMTFSTQNQFNSATSNDYDLEYDKGHMANAEDFAYDCEKEKITFRYYNALPQTPKLNRGIWKQFETKFREESQKDSLFIICGGYDFSIVKNSMRVPRQCFKIVKNIRTKTIRSYIFPNDNSDTYKQVSLDVLLGSLGYDSGNIKLSLK